MGGTVVGGAAVVAGAVAAGAGAVVAGVLDAVVVGPVVPACSFAAIVRVPDEVVPSCWLTALTIPLPTGSPA